MARSRASRTRLADFNFAAVSVLTTQISARVKINFDGRNVLSLEGFNLADYNVADILL